MRLIAWHEKDVARFHMMRLPGDRYLSFSIKQVNECIVRNGVLAELLPLIKGEKSNRALLLLQQCSADDRTVLIVNEIRQIVNIALNVF